MKKSNSNSILNDHTLHKVHVMDHNGNLNSYDYIASSYPLSSFTEAVKVTDNFQMSTGSMTCDCLLYTSDAADE